MLARKCLEEIYRIEREEYMREFVQCDADGSGGISFDEILKVLEGLEFAPLPSVVREVFEEVLDHDSLNSELDFDAYFDFMCIFRKRCGFSRSDVEKMRRLFEKFDSDNSGTMECMELSELFRHMGYGLPLYEIQELVSRVDIDHSGQLDWMEFLTLMRYHRYKEISRVQKVFDRYSKASCLQGDAIGLAVDALGLYMPKEVFWGIGDLDLQGFVTFLDRFRELEVRDARKRAYYSYKHLEVFAQTFSSFDKDGNGLLNPLGLSDLLQELGWAPKSTQERDQLVKDLAVARKEAKDAGERLVKEPHVNFPIFLQLTRIVQTRNEIAEEESFEKELEKLEFSRVEAEQFRECFLYWRTQLEHNSSGMGAPALKRDQVVRLVRFMGISLLGRRNDELIAGLEPLLSSDNSLNFLGFLRLMRWMVDTNFAGIGLQSPGVRR